jgi:hypothetical protein
MPANRRIPLDVAHQVLATFGITEPTPLYERRVKPDGFALDDLHEVLASESPFVFGIDWRAALPDELAPIAAAVAELGAELDVGVPEDADEGSVACAGKREHVKYVPSDEDDFTDVIAAVQKVMPSTIEFRASTSNGYHDGWEFAALLREEWAALERLDRPLIAEMYEPLAARRRA